MKYACIHGHFYQPPRENPYTEVINRQDSAYPFHDWNEVVGFQCYGPNAFSRLLNDDRKIINIINNYQYISFNFGPTLLSWLKQKHSAIYDEVIIADKKSIEFFNGHGSAIAQVYNHIIMPLATRKDKEIQVTWGIQDFEMHYGRKPEGMWLSETAVDIETLEVLAENHIKFTILSPYQAREIREEYEGYYHPINKDTLNTNKPYRVDLPSGKSIVVFFYSADVAHQLSFGDLLNSGDAFYNKIRQQFNFNSSDTEIFNVALDGETFGHHHKHGDMALAYCINKVLTSADVRLVNYGRFLDLYNVTTRVHIHERTSWSCAHGIERWNSNCGCRGGGDPSWNQQWRGPLRAALNALNGRADTFFHSIAQNYFKDVDEVLNNYVEVINNRTRDFTYIFFSRYANKKLNNDDIILLARIFEMKRNTHLMFTSCGWFFTELTGIETVQLLMYADRVIQIYESLAEDVSMIKEFLTLLKSSKSNIPEHKDAEHIYKKWVRPNRQSLAQIAILNSLLQSIESEGDVLDKNLPKVELKNMQRYEMGYMRALKGTFIIESNITFSKRYFYFSLFQLSRANFLGYYNISSEPSENPADTYHLLDTQSLGNINVLLDKVKKKYRQTYALSSLLPEYQALVLEVISNKEQRVVETQMEDIYKRNYPLAMQYLQANIKLPLHLKNVLDFYLVENLKKVLSVEHYHFQKLESIVADIIKWKVSIKHEEDTLQLLGSYLIKYEIDKIKTNPAHIEAICMINQIIQVIKPLELHFNLWDSQNTLLRLLSENKTLYQRIKNEQQDIFLQLKHIAQFTNIDIDYVLQH